MGGCFHTTWAAANPAHAGRCEGRPVSGCDAEAVSILIPKAFSTYSRTSTSPTQCVGFPLMTHVSIILRSKSLEKKITVNSVLLGLLSGPCWLLLGEDALVSSWEARLSWVGPAILSGKAIRQSPVLFLHRPSGTRWRSPADSSPLLTPPVQPQSLGAAGALQPASPAFRDLHNTCSHMLRAHRQGHLGHENSGP